MAMATPSIPEALLPSFVMDGAMNPMMLSGTQKVITCPRIYFKVTTRFRTHVANPPL